MGDGESVGLEDIVGGDDGRADGSELDDGLALGFALGLAKGLFVGDIDGLCVVGLNVGVLVGTGEGAFDEVGLCVDNKVGD